MSRARVHGTSTIANIGICVAGSAAYALGGGAVDLRVGTGMLVGGTLGGLIGPRLLARASERLLRVLLIVILVLTAAKFSVDALGLPLLTHALVPAGLLADLWFVVPATLVVGIVIGAWSGAMGLGGGLLAVPAMVLLFGVELHVAAGTSLLMFIPNSIVGSWVHIRQGTASARWGWLLGLTSAPGVVAGALLGLALDTVVLGLVFATVRAAHGDPRDRGPGPPPGYRSCHVTARAAASTSSTPMPATEWSPKRDASSRNLASVRSSTRTRVMTPAEPASTATSVVAALRALCSPIRSSATE